MRPLWATVFAGLLILSVLALAPGAAHAGAPASQARTPQVSTVVITPTDAYGTPQSDFAAGYANGLVYFSAYDPSGDSSAVVAINDMNASRDHLVNPVASWTVKFPSGSYNDSYYWSGNGYYMIPLDLVYGGTWNITIQGTVGGFSYTNFTVHTFGAYMTPTTPMWMAGHEGTVLFNVNATANNAPYPNVTSLVVSEDYYSTTAGHYVAAPNSPVTVTPAASGSFTFAVPSDAAQFVDFTLWANASSASVKVSEVATLSVPIGTMGSPTVHLANCPFVYCSTGAFTEGTPVYVFVHERIYSFFTSSNGTNLSLKIQFEKGATIVTPPGNVPTTLTTNSTGDAAFVFVASSTVFSTSGANSVVVTVSDPVNSAATSVSTTANFFVIPPTPGFATLQVSLDNLQYYGGDTATANWQIGGVNASLASGWVVDTWQVWAVYSSTLLASGTIGSTQSHGSFQFTVPVGAVGKIRTTVTAHNVSAALSADAFAYATAPTILLTPSEAYYLPGDTVTVSVATEGGILSSAQLWESVTDSSGNTIHSGVLSGNQIQISVPSVGAPAYYRVSVAAQDPTLGVIASSAISVDEGSGYLLFAGVDSVSNYADGSFQPGQTITLHYTIEAVGGAVLPKSFSITVYPSAGYFGSGTGTVYIETSQPSGTLQYTIPSNMPRGAQSFYVYGYMGSCGGYCTTYTQFGVNVNPNPSALSYELGAGSGLTVAWLILFLIVILLAIAGLMMMRRNRGRGGRTDSPKPFTPPTTSSPPPPASPPQTAPAAPWQEPGPKASPSSGSQSPPLPKPGGSN